MWAGLLASACKERGESEENLIFVNALSQLTTSEASILNFLCDFAVKERSPSGLLTASTVTVKLSKLMEVSGRSDIHTLI